MTGVRLYEVTIMAKVAWMPEYKPLQWAVCAGSPAEAIEKIKSNFDLSGVEISTEAAKPAEYIVTNVF